MKKYKNLSCLLTALVAAIALGVSAMLFAATPATAEEPVLSEVLIAEEYLVGDSFVAPDATLTLGDEEYPAESVIVFPDGTAYKSRSLTLTLPGDYTLEYRAVADGALISKSLPFTVNNVLYGVDGENSTVTYGVDASSYNTGKTGIALSLANGETFTFNGVIDLRECNSANNAVLNFFVLPLDKGKIDARGIDITLTDIYDSENWVTIRFYCQDESDDPSNWTHTATYASARASGQVSFTGFEENGYVGAGVTGPIIHKDNGYGPPSTFSMHGDQSGAQAVGNQWLGCYFDLSTNQPFSCGSGGGGFITDLDDPEYTQKDAPWGGFTTGEVYMSITGVGYVKNAINMMITKVADYDLSEEATHDTLAPSITVDYMGYDGDALPDGAVGHTYPVFPAAANDLQCGDVEVSARVFYNYGQPMTYEVDKAGGVFTPRAAGVYTIVYAAKDWSGNETTETVDIVVRSAATPVSLTIDKPEGDDAVVTAGDMVPVAAADYSGGMSELKLEVRVTVEDAEIEIAEDGKFRPDRPGFYTVTYTVSDIVGQEVSDEYQIEAKPASTPIFEDDVVLPEYFIEGTEYTLPALNAYDYNEQGAPVPATISVTDGAGTRDYDGGAVFTPDADGNAKICYKAGTSVIEHVVPVIDVSRADYGIDMAKYFFADGMELSSTMEYVIFTAAENTDTANAEFINALKADNFNIRFLIDPAGNGFEKLNFYFTDSVDKNISVKIGIVKGASAAASPKLYVNGAETAYSFTQANFANGEIFALTYRESGYVITDGMQVNARIETTESGAAFAGFPSGRFYMTMEFEGVSGEAVVDLISINSQMFSNLEEDLKDPDIQILGTYSPNVNLNDVVTVYDARCTDVLDPETINTVTVTTGSGADIEYVTSTSGVLLKDAPLAEYEFVADGYNTYLIAYTAQDDSGNMKTTRASVTVMDDVAPVVVLDGTLPESVSLGTEIAVPAVTVTDNLDEEIGAYAYIADPDYYITPLAAGGDGTYAFTAEKTGVYRVVFLARDAAGNVALLEYRVEAVA